MSELTSQSSKQKTHRKRPVRKMVLGLILLTGLPLLFAGCVLFPPRVVIDSLNRGDDAVYFIAANEPLVALTIDDGPDPESTPRILEILAEHDTKATFFVLGEKARSHPEMMRAIVDAGHEIANHGWQDRRAKSLSEKEFKDDFVKTKNVLEQFGTSRWYRPGGGLYKNAMLETAEEYGHRLVVGSIYPHDAHIPSVDFARSYIATRTKAGDIVVLHDGGDRGKRTARVLAQLIPAIKEKNLKFVTLTDLSESSARHKD